MLADTERLQQTVEQVLKAGVAGQRLALQHRAPVDIAALAGEVARDGAAPPSPAAETMTLSIATPSAAALLVDGDADELRTVLSNLLDNAVKYSRDAVQVAVEVAAPSPDTVWVRVRDRGVGIPRVAAQAHLQPLLPLPDARLQGQRHRPRPLHRALDRQAARRPRLRRQRRRGQGRDLHRGAAATRRRSPRCRPGSTTVPAGLSMARILVVEDEHHLAQGLSLQPRSRRPRGERDRRRRAGAAARCAARPDNSIWSLLDVMLPGRDGFEVAAELRRSGDFVPILMLTARGRPEDVLQGFESGADDYLPKPFELAILLARVRGLLRRSAWSRGHRSAKLAPRRRPTAADVITFAGNTLDISARSSCASGTMPIT